jgi:hemin uptake protein HemP
MVRAMNRNEPDDDVAELLPKESEKVVRAEELFGTLREIWIELDGVRYRLRITRRGKLILQK